MTTNTSPKELVAAYRAGKRLDAAALDAPLDRSAFPGLGMPPTGMIYLRGKKPVYRAMNPTGPAEVLDPEKLASLLTTEGMSTVVADAYTFGKLTVMAGNVPSNDFKALTRRLRISRGLPMSLKLPVLTEALAVRYWMQDGLTDTSLSDWAEAFGFSGLSLPETIRELSSMATAGIRPAGLVYAKTIGNLEGLETRLMSSAGFSGISTDCYVFTMLEGFNAKAGGLRIIDPGLLELHVLDGQVCRVTPMNVTAGKFTAAVSSPFKFKEGRDVRLTDGQRLARTGMQSLRFGGGVLHAEFRTPTNRSGGLDMLRDAKAGIAPLYAAEDVFDGRGQEIKNKRWMGGDVERIPGREVPLDVALAGAPSGD